MTKPTKSVCTERKHITARTFTQSDQSHIVRFLAVQSMENYADSKD